MLTAGLLSPPNKFASRAATAAEEEERNGGKWNCFPGSTNRAANRRRTERQTDWRGLYWCHTRRTHDNSAPTRSQRGQRLKLFFHFQSERQSLGFGIGSNRRRGETLWRRAHRPAAARSASPREGSAASQSRVGFKLRKAELREGGECQSKRKDAPNQTQ